MKRTLSVVDSGALFAAVNADDDNHARCVEVLDRPDLAIIVPSLVVTEVCYMIETRLGSRIEAEFLRGLSPIEIELPTTDDWFAIAELVDRYADFPLGAVDGSVAVLADRLGTDLIITLDRRHFGAIRSTLGTPYRLLPD